MAIRKIARLGHPVLRKPARPLSPDEIGSTWVSQLLADMRETMKDSQGIGLAAPQIHESVQVAIIEIETANPRYPGSKPQPFTVFINPRIEVVDATEQTFWEGCLSIQGIRALVPRPRAIRVEFLDENGEARSIEASGFLATVIQHELDHLQGVLFIDRIRPEPGKTPIAFLEEYQRYILPADPARDLGE